jgi:hypothetical protein
VKKIKRKRKKEIRESGWECGKYDIFSHSSYNFILTCLEHMELEVSKKYLYVGKNV